MDDQTLGRSSNYCSNNFGLINFSSWFAYLPFLKVGKLSSLNLLRLSFLVASFTHPNFEFSTSHNSYVYTTKYNNYRSPINAWIEIFKKNSTNSSQTQKHFQLSPSQNSYYYHMLSYLHHMDYESFNSFVNKYVWYKQNHQWDKESSSCLEQSL